MGKVASQSKNGTPKVTAITVPGDLPDDIPAASAERIERMTRQLAELNAAAKPQATALDLREHALAIRDDLDVVQEIALFLDGVRFKDENPAVVARLLEAAANIDRQLGYMRLHSFEAEGEDRLEARERASARGAL